MSGRAEVAGALTPEWVEVQLMEAGRTLYRLKVPGHGQGVRSNWPDVVRDYWEAYGQTEAVQRLVPATPEEITRMDEVYAWVSAIPDMRYRRAVQLVSLNHPDSHRRLLSDRKISEILKTSNHTVKHWYEKGLSHIAQTLVKNGGSQTSQFQARFAA